MARRKTGSLGVDWFLPGKNRRFATTTQASSDMIRYLGEDGHTVASAFAAILYDDEAKAVLATLASAGYGSTPLKELVR